MTEKDIIELGFKYVYNDDDKEKPFHYFTLDVGSMGFYSCASDETINGDWFIEVGDSGDFEFKCKDELLVLINILKRNKI